MRPVSHPISYERTTNEARVPVARAPTRSRVFIPLIKPMAMANSRRVERRFEFCDISANRPGPSSATHSFCISVSAHSCPTQVYLSAYMIEGALLEFAIARHPAETIPVDRLDFDDRCPGRRPGRHGDTR